MLALDQFTKIYIYRPYIDFRKGIRGSFLAGKIKTKFDLYVLPGN